MKFRKLLGAGLVAALAVAGQAHSAHAEPTDVEYTLELLQPGPGQIVSSGLAVNANGDTAGIVRPESTAQPQFTAVWPADGTDPTVLPQLTDSRFSRPFDINAAGTVVGEAFDADGYTVPIQWVDGEASVVDPLRAEGRGPAAGIADNGDIVSTAGGRAWLVHDGHADRFEMPALTEGEPDGTRVAAISDSGAHAAGTVQVSVPHGDHSHDEDFLLVWHDGHPTAYPSEPDGLAFRVHDVNDSGLVVGRTLVERVTGAVQWRDGVMSRLGDPEVPEMPHTAANAVNADAVVVGHASKFADNTSFGGVAVRWAADGPVDLNTVVELPEGVVLQNAADINADGVIVGSASTPDGMRAFRLTPVAGDADPEPEQPITEPENPVTDPGAPGGSAGTGSGTGDGTPGGGEAPTPPAGSTPAPGARAPQGLPATGN